MKTSALVLADSVSPLGIRLTTLQVCFPRFILAEVNTHRVLSRNFRSSRAVPVTKMIEEVRKTPFIPSQFTRNKPGMQGGEALSGRDLQWAEQAWRDAARAAADHAEMLAQAGVHKQYANRGLEPYLYVHGVISATEWDNFFALRCHPDAQPEFQELAQCIREAMAGSEPVVRSPIGARDELHSHWHLPYVTDAERAEHPFRILQFMSAARCAWVSYKPYDESEATDLQKVDRTVEKLLGTPMHASPFEHQATPWPTQPKGNFTHWLQLRHVIEARRNA